MDLIKLKGITDMSTMIHIKNFPQSFKMLHQEALLTNSSILSGFEYLAKGNFNDKCKGGLYSAFFNLSIGFERIMKLALISNHMLENDYAMPPHKVIRDYRHDISLLFNKCLNLCNKYQIKYDYLKDIDKDILTFINDFADATKGRYFNISSSEANKNDDPIQKWKRITYNIYYSDFKEITKSIIESKINKNTFLTSHYFQELALNNVDIIDEARLIYITEKSNKYIIWRLIKILEPIIDLLIYLSNESHRIDTMEKNINYPSFPYYNEMFLFYYTSKEKALRLKNWTDLLFN